MQRTVIIGSNGFDREASANLLAGTEFDVVAAASPDGDLRKVLAQSRPDLVLLDLARGASLTGVLDAVGVASPGAKPVVLADENDVDRVVPAFEHGARGLLSRHRSASELLQKLRTVVEGQIVIDPRLAAPLAEFVTRGIRVTGPYGLSRSEELVIAHLPRELTNRQIGRRIGVSDATVRTHLRNAFEKLGVRDRVEAALFAVERGLA